MKAHMPAKKSTNTKAAKPAKPAKPAKSVKSGRATPADKPVKVSKPKHRPNKSPDASAQVTNHLMHGALKLPSVTIGNYSLELRNGDSFIGDSVSRSAFRDTVEVWRKLFAAMDGQDAFGSKPAVEISKKKLDALWQGETLAATAINAAMDDYALQLCGVVQQFLADKSWAGVERIVVGGGFQQSAVGRAAIQKAAHLLAVQQLKVQMQTLRHHADEGGLLGWVHLAPPEFIRHYDALLTVDIGGTNVRCGIVRHNRKKAADLSKAVVLSRTKWSHADDNDVTSRMALVEGIAAMLEKLVAKAKKKGLRLAPFVGVACPGLICDDGSIAAGAQNLPGNWESMRFNLSTHLSQLLRPIDGQPALVQLHNDAVVQGLSELPFMQDVRRWAVLTVGTGLGNASFANPPRLMQA